LAFWFRKRNRKLFILGIDGVPFSLLQEALAKDMMPNFKRLSQQGSLIKMNSVIPTISSVAWATFACGVNPAKHNIYGFVDRDENMNLFIPNAAHMRAKTLWHQLNEYGKRVILINLPIAYPPSPVDGIMVSGFLGTDLDKCVYPKRIAPILKKMNYIVDPDSRRAKTDKEGFLNELFAALRARREAAFSFLKHEAWDFFMLHVMETDRLNHFFLEAKDDHNSKYYQEFWKLYKQVDELIGEIHAELSGAADFMILSDHGFCKLLFEVDLNEYLRQQGFLHYKTEEAKELADIHPESKAYSLIPGRIFINLKGRQKVGSEEYQNLRGAIMESLLKLKDPQNGLPIIEHVYGREELYDGPYLERSADLIAMPNKGYDLKGKINSGRLLEKSYIVGMHTYDDALLFIKDHKLNSKEPAIVDVTPTIFELMGLPVPEELEGISLLGDAK